MMEWQRNDYSSLILPLSDIGMREKDRNVGGTRLEWGVTVKWMEWSHEEKDIKKEWPNDGRMREISELKVLP